MSGYTGRGTKRQRIDLLDITADTVTSNCFEVKDEYTLPKVDGDPGFVPVTDGFGTVTWQTTPTPQDIDVNTAKATCFEVTNEYTLPKVDGDPGFVPVTDGAGTVTWQTTPPPPVPTLQQVYDQSTAPQITTTPVGGSLTIVAEQDTEALEILNSSLDNLFSVSKTQGIKVNNYTAFPLSDNSRLNAFNYNIEWSAGTINTAVWKRKFMAFASYGEVEVSGIDSTSVDIADPILRTGSNISINDDPFAVYKITVVGRFSCSSNSQSITFNVAALGLTIAQHNVVLDNNSLDEQFIATFDLNFNRLTGEWTSLMNFNGKNGIVSVQQRSALNLVINPFQVYDLKVFSFWPTTSLDNTWTAENMDIYQVL